MILDTPKHYKAHSPLFPLDNQKSTAQARKGCMIIYHAFSIMLCFSVPKVSFKFMTVLFLPDHTINIKESGGVWFNFSSFYCNYYFLKSLKS